MDESTINPLTVQQANLIKTATGSLSSGLFVVAAVEICATLLILKFIPHFGKGAAR